MDRLPPLYPWSLNRLLGRVALEWEHRREIFSLAGRRFFAPVPGIDLGREGAGGRSATPVGPAAGPHTQLAQNIALAWLAGSRSFELKTVQVLDELDIDRPCIDMESVGYNIEWSQELRLEESLDEYAKAALLLAVLRRWEPLRDALPGADDAFFDHVFELSVGYDLAGIQSGAMTRFLQGIRAVSGRIDALRAEIPDSFAALRDVPVPSSLVTMTNLSTFHGCPPEEIEGIVKHLMSAHDLDVTVKLNPTLLGLEPVRGILHDRLGYGNIPLSPEAFTQDLQFDRAVEMIGSLQEFAQDRGRRFGVKLTNTLVVGNQRGVLPGETMYLSGAPLHVLAIELLDRLVAALPGVFALGPEPGPVPVAFSAGIDKGNLAATVALGLEPVTVCSDLLRPGGYGRLAQGLRSLQKTMATAGFSTLDDLCGQAHDEAVAAGYRDAVQARVAQLRTAEGAAPYGKAARDKPLRRVEQALRPFDCVACNNCVSVCPNNAFVALPTGDAVGLKARDQYLVLAELCNDCGNCTTFCPEEGAPQRIKPRLFFRPDAFAAGNGGYLLSAEGGEWVVQPGERESADSLAKMRALLAGKGAAGLPIPGGEN